MNTETGLKSCWSWFFGLGLILVILGVVAIATPYLATFASVMSFGWLILIAGVAQFFFSFYNRRTGDFLLHVLIGLFSILIGILMIMNPAVTAATITLLLAVFFLRCGIISSF